MYDPEVRRDTPLALKLKDTIARDGAIPVSDYMAQCLWDEDYGYYATRTVIGSTGDFITAAEISQVFGELIGLWCGVVWKQGLDAPASLRLVEYGPGRGTMMRDCLRAAAIVPGFIQAASVHLLEMSDVLTQAQRDALANCGAPVTWGHNLAGFAPPAIILANEFLDAWPVEQWVNTDLGWFPRGVGTDRAGRLVFTALNGEHRRDDLDQRFTDAPIGAIYETQRPERLAEAFKALSQKGPIAALIIDYGHVTSVSGDTLQAVRGHAYESPLTSPGEADLSAQISFYELATALHAAGLAIDGPVTQAEFLGSLGIVERASRLMSANPARAGEIESGVARLIAPNGMGTRFKAIGVRSPQLPALPGFGS
ncbi:MAG: SAM-dependent methyltransferase [Hyphomicrobium sp.]|nr:SAM-dependent methyltransferase [Hyphomicrobium sp.]